MSKRIVIVGAGAVGGYFGAYLTKAGHDVTLVDPWPENVEAIRTTGMKLSGVTPEESMTLKVNAIHLTDVQNLIKQKPIDIAVIAMKSYDTVWATMLIKPYLAADAYVVSLQNCINEERVASVVGWGRTIGCIASDFSSELIGPGEIRRYYPRGDKNNFVYRAGELHGRVTKRLEEFVEIASAADTATATSNLWGERWSKLCVNGMRNGLSAASGLSGADMARTDHIRRFMIRLGGQAVRVGQANGYSFDKVYRMKADTMARAAEGDKAAMEECEDVLLQRVNSGMQSEGQRPSMGQDMIKGRRTEIDFINGVIVEQGEPLGLPIDTHKHMVRLVTAVERGELTPSPDHFEGL